MISNCKRSALDCMCHFMKFELIVTPYYFLLKKLEGIIRLTYFEYNLIMIFCLSCQTEQVKAFKVDCKSI